MRRGLAEYIARFAEVSAQEGNLGAPIGRKPCTRGAFVVRPAPVVPAAGPKWQHDGSGPTAQTVQAVHTAWTVYLCGRAPAARRRVRRERGDLGLRNGEGS